MRAFEYVKPKSVQEALNLADQYESGAASFKAGGTDLFVQMKNQVIAPHYIIDLQGLEELKGISLEKGFVKIGALTCMNEIAEDPTLPKLGLHILSEAARKLGSYQIRNRATLGGNLCNASPAAEMATPLLVMEAKATLEGKNGRRTVSLEEFFRGPGKTLLGKGELLLSLEVQKQEEGMRAGHLKHCRRRAMDLAVVGIAAKICMRDGGSCQDARIALGAVAPTPIRVRQVEEGLVGKKITEDVARWAGEVAAKAASPITDIRGSADYRRQIIKVQLRRLLRELAGG